MNTALSITGDVVSGDHKVNVGYIGCGSHSFRNILPALQFTDLRLIATCDLDGEKAALYARQFGARRHYTDYRDMLAREDLEGVLAVLDYDEQGYPQYPQVANHIMESGSQAWIEKPPAASVEEIEDLMDTAEETGCWTMVGFKKCFTPGAQRIKEVMSCENFGELNTLYIRYPQALPPPTNDRPLEHGPDLVGLLDHLVHPASLASFLGGGFGTVFCQSSSQRGGFLHIEFAGGGLGTIHMASGSSGKSPLERVEVVGEGANIILENGVRLHYYPPGGRGAYGSTTSYLGGRGGEPVCIEPEFSLGQLYNKNLFMLGYYQELQRFAELCREGRKPQGPGSLEMALEILKLYEAVLKPQGRVYTF